MSKDMEWGGMAFDNTIHLGDVIVGIIGLICIPVARVLISTLVALRDAVTELKLIVVGTEKDPSTGILGDVAALKKETLKHRDRLIRLEAEANLAIQDRT